MVAQTVKFQQFVSFCADATLELDHEVVECVEKSAIVISGFVNVSRRREPASASRAIRKSAAEGVCFDRQTDNRGRMTACNAMHP